MVAPASHRVPRVRWYLGISSIPHTTDFTYRAITFCGGPFQTLRLSACTKRASDTRLRENPTTSWRQRMSAITPPGFGLLPVRSPLLGQSRLISLATGTEMFHFTVCRSHRLWIQRWVLPDEWQGVAPLGDLRINACLRLPEAYRSLPRPSSPIETEASTGSSW